MKRKAYKDKDEVQDDLIQFRDSARSSVFQSSTFLVDTPTRLVNESNEFLIKVRKAKKVSRKGTPQQSLDRQSKGSTPKRE